MGFNPLKDAEPLRGDSLFFTTKFLEIAGTHLINLKDERLSRPWSLLVILNMHGTPGLGIQRLNH